MINNSPAKCEQGLVDVARLARSEALGARLGDVLRTGEIDESQRRRHRLIVALERHNECEDAVSTVTHLVHLRLRVARALLRLGEECHHLLERFNVDLRQARADAAALLVIDESELVGGLGGGGSSSRCHGLLLEGIGLVALDEEVLEVFVVDLEEGRLDLF